MALTGWLDSVPLVSQPDHPLFPALVQPASFREWAKWRCRGCVQGGRTGEDCATGHGSYERGYLTGALPANMIPSLSLLRDMQWLVHRLCVDAMGLCGSEDPTAYAATEADQAAFAVTWTVDSVDGTELVLSCAGEDPGARVICTWKKPNTITGTTSVTEYGPPQPGDIVEPIWPSVLAYKCRPSIKKVVLDRTAGTATVTVDQDMTNLMVDGRAGDNGSVSYQVKTWRAAGMMESWTQIVEGHHLHCRRRRIWLTLADLDSDGRVLLKRTDGTDGLIAFPESAGPAGTVRPATLTVARVNSDGSVDDLSVTCHARVFCEATGDGTDGRGVYRTWLCLGDKDYSGAVAFGGVSLLAVGTSGFRVTYWPECTAAQVSSGVYRIPCERRCRYSQQDMSGSIYDPDDGEAETSGGEVWRCVKRQWYEWQEEMDGSWTQIWHAPSGIGSYKPDCCLYGVCDQFLEAGRGAEGERPFTVWQTASRVFAELVARANWRLVQLVPGISLPSNYQLDRVAGPSLWQLHGGPVLVNPTGWHSTIVWRDWGCGYVGDFDTTIDGSGNERFAPLVGAMWDSRVAFADVVFGSASTYPGAGVLASISGWTTKRDALRELLDDTSDPAKARRVSEWLASYRLENDTGDDVGRHVARASRVVGGDESFLLERVNFATADDDAWQDRDDIRLAVYESAQSGPGGWQYGAMIEVKLLTANDKVATGTVVSGVVASVSVADGIATIDIVNQEQAWSYLKTVDGESWDEEVTWHGGGMFVDPPDWLKVRSVVRDDSSIGGVERLAACGDAVKFTLTPAGHPEFGSYLFTVLRAEAFGGAAAADWGGGHTAPGDSVCDVPEYSTGRAWGKNMDRIWVCDENGWIADHAASLVGVAITCVRGEQVLDPRSAPEVGCASYGEETFASVGSSDVLTECGRGRVYISPSAVATLAAAGEVCVRVA